MTDPITTEIHADGLRLVADVRGDGDPVVFIAGSGMPAYAWDLVDLSAFCDAGYQVVTFDSRGIDRSDGPPAPYSVAEMAADTAAVIEQLDLGPSRIVGVSLGGFIAQHLAGTRPDLVRALVLWASAGRTTLFCRAKVEAEVELFRHCDPPPSWDTAEALTVALPAQTLQNDDDAVRGWLELLGAQPPWSGEGRRGQYAASNAWLLDENHAERWADIRCPCLVIAFEHDLFFPPSHGREAAAAMPHGEVVEIPGLAHGGIFEGAPSMRDAVLQFFRNN